MKALVRAQQALKGFGDYTIMGNTLTTGGMNPPAIVNSVDKGEFIIRHREYIQDIIPTEDFTVQCNLPLNPGLFETFPWLAGIAENFEEYEFRGLLFEYVSTSADSVLSAGATTALGSVSMATQYNVLSAPFSNKKQMLNYEFANSTKPSHDLLHPVECKRALTPQTKLWVRTPETDLIDADRRLYDLGDFILATEGCQGAGAVGNIGQLWCTFEIALLKAKLVDGAPFGEPIVDEFRSGPWTGTAAAFQPIFGIEADRVQVGTLGGTMTGGANGFPSATYTFRTVPKIPIGTRFLVTVALWTNELHTKSANPITWLTPGLDLVPYYFGTYDTWTAPIGVGTNATIINLAVEMADPDGNASITPVQNFATALAGTANYSNVTVVQVL